MFTIERFIEALIETKEHKAVLVRSMKELLEIGQMDLAKHEYEKKVNWQIESKDYFNEEPQIKREFSEDENLYFDTPEGAKWYKEYYEIEPTTPEKLLPPWESLSIEEREKEGNIVLEDLISELINHKKLVSYQYETMTTFSLWECLEDNTSDAETSENYQDLFCKIKNKFPIYFSEKNKFPAIINNQDIKTNRQRNEVKTTVFNKEELGILVIRLLKLKLITTDNYKWIAQTIAPICGFSSKTFYDTLTTSPPKPNEYQKEKIKSFLLKVIANL